jgi:hypothetical protein
MRTTKIVQCAAGCTLASAALTAAAAAGAGELDPAGEIGAYFHVSPGAAGKLKNQPIQLSPGISFAVGRTVRYHLLVGYSYIDLGVGGVSGFEARPAILGIPLTLTSSESMAFAIEPLIDIIGVEGYFVDGSALFMFESGLGIQAVLNFKHAFVALGPQFQFRFAGAGGAGANAFGGTGLGFNIPIRLTGGLRF